MATFSRTRQILADPGWYQEEGPFRPDSSGSEETTLRELTQLLGPLVNPLLRGPDGALDLSRIPSASFDEFKKFLLTQVSVDGIAFNAALFDSYPKVLAKEKYRPLLEAAYRRARSGPGTTTLQEAPREDLLKQFTADIIGVSAQRFVGSHLDNQEGRKRIHSVLSDPSSYTRDCRSDLIKAIAAVGNQQGVTQGHWEGIDGQIDSWNYWNLGVTEAEVQRATYHALKILEEAKWQEEDVWALQKKYREAPDPLREKFQLYLAKRDRTDPVSQFQARLANFWLWVADDEAWRRDNESATSENRAYLLKKIEGLLVESEGIGGETALARFNQRLAEFLEAPLPREGAGFFHWLEHKALGRGLEELFAMVPSRLRAPYDELRQFSQEIGHAMSMGERVFPNVTGVRAKEAGVRQAVLHLIEGLEQSKRGLWFSYKQHRALSRGVSQVASWGGGGDVVAIRKANQFIDDLIVRARNADSKPELKRIVDMLQSGLKEAGVMHRALAAAEMDGMEQLVGLGQSVLIMMATVAATQGLGAVSVLGNLSRLAGAIKNIQTVAGQSAQWAALAHRASYGLRMGAWLSFAENQIAMQSGEVRQGRDSWWKLGKDSLATGLAMGLFTPLAAEMGLGLERNVLKRLMQRYFTRGVQGIGRFAGDTVLEGMEEIVDATLRHKLDGGVGGVTLDQAREIALVTALGGGTKMGTLAGAFRTQVKAVPRPNKIQFEIPDTAPPELALAHWKNKLPFGVSGFPLLGVVPFMETDPISHFSERLNLSPGSLGVMGVLLGLWGLGMVKSGGRRPRVSEQEIVDAMEKHGGDRALAARELSLAKVTVDLRIAKAKPDSPLGKYKVIWTDAQIAEVLARHDDLSEAAKEMPIGKGALKNRLRKALEDSPLYPFKEKRYVVSQKTRESFKYQRKVTDEMLARALSKYDGNQKRASSDLPITPQAISSRIRRAHEDSPLAKFKKRGPGHRLIPLALGFGMGVGELLSPSAAQASVPAWVEAAPPPAQTAGGGWGWAGLAAGVLMAAGSGLQSRKKRLLQFLGEQLCLSPEQLSERYPHMEPGLELLASLADEKGWSPSEQEQFLMANHIWLSRPDWVDKVLPLLRDPELGFKSLKWIFSFQEKGRGAIDLNAEIEARALVYRALRGLHLDEARKVDFITRWNLARADRIKPPRFTYSLNKEVFAALAAMDKVLEKPMSEDDSSPARENLRRSYAGFLTSYGQYQRALEVLAPIEQNEIIYPEQTKPVLKVQMAEQFFSHGDFPELRSNGRHPQQDFAWQSELSNAMADIPDWNTTETTFPLDRVIPYHFLGHARHHESFLDTVNQIRKGWLFDLMVKGWHPGSPVEPQILKKLMVSSETPHHLPMISAESEQGYALVLNGHHRLASLISLVTEGIFPPDTLAHVPLERVQGVRPSHLMQRVFDASQYLPKFSWADVLQFHDSSVARIPDLGLDADYDRLR